MIDKVLQFTGSILDQYVKNRFGLDESKVVVNNLVDNNGQFPQINLNKIVISLINVEKETIRRDGVRDAVFNEVEKSAIFNLDVLISCNFDDYSESLKFLDVVLNFFMTYPGADASVFSNIPAGISKLEYEKEKINYYQIQSLWKTIGATYRPSVIYKIKHLSEQPRGVNMGFKPTI